MLGAKVQFPTTSKESIEKVEKMKKGYGVICIFCKKIVVIDLTEKLGKKLLQ